LKAGDNTSAITNDKAGAARTSTPTWIPIEIAILKDKSASQEANCLVDNSSPGALVLLTVNFTLVINIKTKSQ